MKKTGAILYLSLLWLSLQAQVKDPEVLRIQAEEELKRCAELYDVAGASVLLEEQGEVLFSGQWGEAQRIDSLPVPVTDSTIFRIGSISKVLTALAVLQLQEAGKLRLDDPLEKYLPELNWTYEEGLEPVKIRHILSHTSGLTEAIWNGFFSDMENNSAFLLEQAARIHIVRPQGRLRSYSNLGYGLLGVLIERVSGLSYAAYLQQHIFEPLGMQRSGVVGVDSMSAPLSDGYIEADSSLVNSGTEAEPPIRDAAAGGLFSTAKDLSRLAQELRRPSVLSELVIMGLREPRTAALSTGEPFRLGFYDMDIDGLSDSLIGTVYGHGGDTRYFHSSLAFAEKAELSLVILSNTEKFPSRFYNELNERLFQLYSNHLDSSSQEAAAPTELDFSLFDPEVVVGDYELGTGDLLRIKKWRKTGLKFLQNRRALRLKRQENGSYTGKFMLFRLIPIKADGFGLAFDTLQQEVYMVSLDEKGGRTYFAKRRPVSVATSAFENFEGKCRVLNEVPDAYHFIPQRVSIRKKPFALELHTRLPWEEDERIWTFYIVNEDTAVSHGTLRGAGTTLRALGNNRYWWSGFEFEVLPD